MFFYLGPEGLLERQVFRAGLLDDGGGADGGFEGRGDGYGGEVGGWGLGGGEEFWEGFLDVLREVGSGVVDGEVGWVGEVGEVDWKLRSD